jgi:hypothetical protein
MTNFIFQEIRKKAESQSDSAFFPPKPNKCCHSDEGGISLNFEMIEFLELPLNLKR